MIPNGHYQRLLLENWVVASHNQGKVSEIRDLLTPYGITLVSAGELNLEEPEETGSTFVENAELKAHAASQSSGRIALADDSGLSVDALDGAPGIYSARWAISPEGNKSFSWAIKRIEEALKEIPDASYKAKFVCVLSLAWPDGYCESFEGIVEGELIFPPAGNKGFGYDPIFRPEGYDLCFAEMQPKLKHSISHRAKAFSMLVSTCLDANNPLL